MPDLSAETIAAALTTRRLGHPVIYRDSLSSTNDLLKEHAAAGAPEGLLAVADQQTAGRGRGNRSWWAPPGSSLLMSLLLRPPLPAARAQQTTMCLGLGAVEGIAEVTGLQAGLKWPNDLVLSGRKLAGMLTEIDGTGDRLAWVVIGMGINVNMGLAPAPTEPGTTAPPPQDVASSSISLSQALGRPVPRLDLLVAILSATERWYGRLLAGMSPQEAWSARLDTLGREVTVTQPSGLLRGTATGVSPEGALLVQTLDGQVHTIWAGDITTLR